MIVRRERSAELAYTIIAAANGCGDHPLDIDPAEPVDEVLYLRREERETWEDSSSVALYRTGARFRVVRESSDSSGHGCRCAASTSIHGSLGEAMMLGLTRGEREDYARHMAEV